MMVKRLFKMINHFYPQFDLQNVADLIVSKALSKTTPIENSIVNANSQERLEDDAANLRLYLLAVEGCLTKRSRRTTF